MEPDEIVVRGVAVEWRLPWLGLAITAAVLAVLVTVGLIAGEGAVCGIVAVALIASAVTVPLLEWRKDRMTLRVTRAGVRLGEGKTERFISRESMRRVLVLPDERDVTLLIEVGWERILLKLPRPIERGLATARQCVERLEMAPHQRVLVFRDFVGLARWVTTGVLGLPLGIVAALCVGAMVGPALPRAVSWVVGALEVWAFSRVVRPTDVVIGADGMELRGIWRTRFFSFATLHGVAWPMPGSELEVREIGVVTTRYGWTSLVDDDEGRRGFAFALDWARERYTARRRESELAPLLTRGDRTLAAWRSSLHELAQGGAAYRASALDGDEVARLLDDPSAEGESRVGAALVLTAEPSSEASTRVRVAAEACAHAPTRVALERVAEGTLDDAALVALARARR